MLRPLAHQLGLPPPSVVQVLPHQAQPRPGAPTTHRAPTRERLQPFPHPLLAFNASLLVHQLPQHLLPPPQHRPRDSESTLLDESTLSLLRPHPIIPSMSPSLPLPMAAPPVLIAAPPRIQEQHPHTNNSLNPSRASSIPLQTTPCQLPVPHGSTQQSRLCLAPTLVVRPPSSPLAQAA